MDIRFQFMKYRKLAAYISIALFTISILSIVFRGLNLGLDFSGGMHVEVKYDAPVKLESIRESLSENGFEDFQVTNFGSNLDILIKVQLPEILDIKIRPKDISNNDKSEDQGEEYKIIDAEDVYNAVSKINGVNSILQKSDTVGPQIGEELRDDGGFGMLIALFLILFYVAFRFQYKFALGAVAALFHDIVIILGLFSIFGWDFDLTVLAALLAVIGYSLNDTIVVSDRIRENFRTERELDPQEMIDLSLNQTLGRTVVTSFTTLLVLFALFIFGGEMIKGFSLALILGVLVGTYSSIYVVANMLMSLTLTKEDLAIPEPEGADFDELP
tara:strand:- start:9 stop:995 length:987 start_codon:yes stop_codon:yes gene_type:complete